MVLDWLPRSRSVDELVTKGRYRQAVAVLRTQFEGRSPTLAERLRLADLLVLADHGDQALPILLGVADELARYGFGDRALEALRRADAIAPGHPEVRGRFAALSRAARARIAKATAAARPAEVKPAPPVPLAATPATSPPPAAPAPPPVDEVRLAF